MAATDFRAKLVTCIDQARQVIDDLGLRVEEVQVTTREWSGVTGAGLPNDGLQLGAGTQSETDLFTITPRPLVSNPRPRLVAADPGKYLEGDRIISGISRALERDVFPDAPKGGGGEAVERYFLIDGEPYRMVREPQKENFEWIIHVRRMRRRPALP